MSSLLTFTRSLLSTPVLGQDGRMHPAWQRFFTDLYQRVGGQQAASNTELGRDLATLTTEVDAMVTSLSADLEAQSQAILLGTLLPTIQGQRAELFGLEPWMGAGMSSGGLGLEPWAAPWALPTDFPSAAPVPDVARLDDFGLGGFA